MATEMKERRGLDADEDGDDELEDLDGGRTVEAGDGDVDLGGVEEAGVGDEELGCVEENRGEERTLALRGAHIE
jgi:hypothetical protein